MDAQARTESDPSRAQSEERALRPLAAALGVLGDFHDVVFAKDREGRYLMANAEAARVAGIPEAAMIGRTDLELFGAEGEKIRALDEEILASGRAKRIEEVIVVDGEPRTFLTSKAPLRDSHGRVIGLVATSTDITARTEIEQQLRHREAQLAEVQRIAGVGSWEINLVTGEVSWSPEIYDLYGVDPETYEPEYSSILRCMHPADRERVDRAVKRAIEEHEEFGVVHRVVHADGEVRTLLCRGDLLYDVDGSPVRLVGAALDLTEQFRATEELRSKEAQLTAAEELAGIGSFEWDLVSDRLVWSDGLYRIFGRDRDEGPVSFETFLGFLPVEEREDRRALLEELTRSGDSHSSEERYIRADGEERWQSSRIRVLRDDDGRPVRMIGACRDVTERKQAELALHAEISAVRGQALLDPLTKLANRTLAHDRLEHALALRERRRCDVGVLFVDLDHFKQINDRYGHAVGDEVLAAAARRLRDAGRESDTVARIGGDEFLVVCEEIDGARDALALAERLVEQFAAPFEGADEDLGLSISVGVSLAGDRDVIPDDMIRESDYAMYRAKSDAGSAIALFEPAP